MWDSYKGVAKTPPALEKKMKISLRHLGSQQMGDKSVELAPDCLIFTGPQTQTKFDNSAFPIGMRGTFSI